MQELYANNWDTPLEVYQSCTRYDIIITSNSAIVSMSLPFLEQQIVLHNVQCFGTEARLIDCQSSVGTSCNSNAGVQCYMPTSRLKKGHTLYLM